MAKKIIFQTGSQQRSTSPFPAFRTAIEAIRNGRVGQLKSIKVGIGIDKASGKPLAAMPMPATFDYDTWARTLSSTRLHGRTLPPAGHTWPSRLDHH